MNLISAHYLIHSLWEQFLGNHGAVKSNVKWPDDRDIAMLFCLRIDGDNYTPGKGKRSVSHTINIIVTKGHRCYVSLERSGPFDLPDPTRFKNTSNHDSCWYTDGLSIINTTVFDINRYVNEPLVAAGLPSKPPKDLDPFTQFGYGISMPKAVQFVRVKRAPVEDENNYFDKLVGIEALDFSININKEPS